MTHFPRSVRPAPNADLASPLIPTIRHNEAGRKRLAKWMAQFSFRNTKLEDFHDRFNDEEMKTLRIDVENHSYAFLSILFCTDNS
jgi:hypothetical protein